MFPHPEVKFLGRREPVEKQGTAKGEEKMTRNLWPRGKVKNFSMLGDKRVNLEDTLKRDAKA